MKPSVFWKPTDPIFEAVLPTHVWRIYADGQTEGFPKEAVIINRIAPVLNALQARIEETRR